MLRWKNSIKRFWGFVITITPQSFHRYARSAANAARCAAEQGEWWRFNDSLYGTSDQLNSERYLLIGEQLRLELSPFKACLQSQRHLPLVDADIKLGRTLGFGNVPVVLVNGLYIKGPRSLAVYQYYIDRELAGKGLRRENIAGIEHASVPGDLVKSTLPVRLLATSLSNRDDASTAIVEFVNSADIRTFKPGDWLLPEVVLLSIEVDRITIDNRGSHEYIKLQNLAAEDGGNTEQTSYATNAEQLAGEAGVQVASQQNTQQDTAPAGQVRTLPPKGEMVLSAEWLDAQLENRARLEKHFHNAEHVVEGYHMVRLDDVSREVFYKTLGLQSGDVIMRVDDQWVHEGQNPLWDKLGNSETVTVTLMRKGFPIRHDYRIER